MRLQVFSLCHLPGHFLLPGNFAYFLMKIACLCVAGKYTMLLSAKQPSSLIHSHLNTLTSLSFIVCICRTNTTLTAIPQKFPSVDNVSSYCCLIVWFVTSIVKVHTLLLILLPSKGPHTWVRSSDYYYRIDFIRAMYAKKAGAESKIGWIYYKIVKFVIKHITTNFIENISH